MNCKQFHDHLDDYVDGMLSQEQSQSMQQHEAGCLDCQHALGQQQALMQALKSMPAPKMRPGFAQQAIKRATEPQQQHHRRGFVTGFGSALVAGLALWMVVTAMLPNNEAVMQEDVMQVMLSLHQESTINLAFNAPKDLVGAKISLILPANVEVIGFPGQREITWITDLNKGQNILPLPLKASAAVDDFLVASIESGQSKKTFRIQIEVTNQGRTELVITPANMV
ncbi:MAG: zf-HC2 domain-containing protein [Candidatus Polarisedimenticolaceae bacterium]|nr:zf-HC2 domain-containing protein [Candidatus Polarisedimenticolaceae bacterium]